jgi:hypothetical protein
MIVLSELFRVDCNTPVWAMELIADRHPGNFDGWIVKKEFEPQVPDDHPHRLRPVLT